MTTIVYRDGVLAADTRSMAGGWIMCGSCSKVSKTADGRLLGITGDLAEASALAEWLRTLPAKRAVARPALKENSAVIEISARGSIRTYEGAGCFKITAPYYAWGSGSPPAIAALYMGASAVEAVKIAARVDNNTGSKVHSVSIGKLKK
jgi:20S proteasome alpha/beta subunit